MGRPHTTALHHLVPSLGELDAGQPGRDWRSVRVLGVSPQGSSDDFALPDLPTRLGVGDLVVLNDSATLPASLHGHVDGHRIELRLTGPAPTPRTEPWFSSRWDAVVFGEGDWRTATENRPKPPPLGVGDVLEFGSLSARIERTDGRRVTAHFDRSGDALARAIYAFGRPIQYRHLHHPLNLNEVQTPYAGRPWSVEMPSTGHPLHWPLLDALRTRGVQVAWLTHAAGISSTGDAALDASLPFAERYDVPESTLRAARRADRVIAVGTTVVRALESAARGARSGVTDLRLGVTTKRLLVDGILTGVHSPGESHWQLLRAFASDATLLSARHQAASRGYLAHEFGDLMLVA